MADMALIGWVKLHRRLVGSPVWKKHNACRVFIWLLIEAAHAERYDNSSGRPVLLKRGQVYASIAQTMDACGMTSKEVRNAFSFLEKQKMVVRAESVFKIVNYHLYQDRDGDGVSSQGDDAGTPAPESDSGQADGQADGQGEGQDNSAKKGKDASGKKAKRNKGKRGRDPEVGAKPDEKEGQGKGQDDGQGNGQDILNNDEEVSRSFKKTDIPPNPPQAGGDFKFFENLVFEVWKEVGAKYGRAAGKDVPTVKGVASLAKMMLAGNFDEKCLRSGLREFLSQVTKDTKKASWNLRTFAKTPFTYIPPETPRTVSFTTPSGTTTPMKKWRLKCDTCKRVFILERAVADGPPPPSRCFLYNKNQKQCTGTMSYFGDE